MIRVLLIDDHPTVRTGIRLLLEQAADITVVGESGRGSDALRLAERLMPDVILLDMEMPDKSGVEVAKDLRDAELPVRVLALSAHDDEQYIANLFAQGAAGYLIKEEAPETIVQAVRNVAQGNDRWIGPKLAARINPALRQRWRMRDPVQLTERETEVLQLLSAGSATAQIAETLQISERTVRFHLSNIYDKLNVSSRSEAIAWAQRNLLDSSS